MANRLLAVATSTTLTLCELEKDGNINVKTNTPLTEAPLQHGVIWEADDNGGVLVASRTGIARHDENGALIKTLLDSGSVKGLVRKPKTRQVYVCDGEQLLRLDATKNVSLVQGEFCANVSNLAVSPDGLYISALATPPWVFDTKNSTRIALEGVHLGSVTACAFSQLVPGRLFVGLSNGDLLVYDILKDAFPTKRISVGSGGILSIAACPATTARVGTADGTGRIVLLDIEKDKPIRKIWNVNQTLTSILYHPSGSSIYVGTDDGKIFSCSLRQTAEEPRLFSLNKNTSSILSLALQAKPQSATSRSGPKASLSPKAAVSRPPLADESNRPRPSASPAQKPRVTRASAREAKASTLKGASTPPKVAPLVSKFTNSPLDGKKLKASTIGARKPGSPLSRATSASVVSISASRLTSLSSEASGLLTIPRGASRPSSVTSNISRGSTRIGAKTAQASASSSGTSHASPALTAMGLGSYSGLTNSPSLPSMDADMTAMQLPLDPKRPFFSRLSSASPVPSEEARPSAASASAPKSAQGVAAPPAEPTTGANQVVGQKRVAWEEPEPEQDLQLGPTPEENIDWGGALTQEGAIDSVSAKAVWASVGLSNDGDVGKISLGENLNDVLYQLRQEVKKDIVGLHLDLVRMGRNLKTEMQAAIHEHMSTITDLRNENARLRQENERLRRGF